MNGLASSIGYKGANSLPLSSWFLFVAQMLSSRSEFKLSVHTLNSGFEFRLMNSTLLMFQLHLGTCKYYTTVKSIKSVTKSSAKGSDCFKTLDSKL